MPGKTRMMAVMATAWSMMTATALAAESSEDPPCRKNLSTEFSCPYPDQISDLPPIYRELCGEFFEDVNFGGKSKSFGPQGSIDNLEKIFPVVRVTHFGGRVTYENGPNWNDRISSLRVGQALKVELFEDVNFGGERHVILGRSALSDLNTIGWNDRISSIKWCVYR